MTLVKQDRDGAVLCLTLNRPEKMNAYSVDLHHALHDAIDAADHDPSVRVIVVTGAGKAFCAGADISQGFSGAGLNQSAPEIDGVPRDYGGLLNLRIFECDTPIIAAVNGVAVGIGATMLLPMDIKIMSDSARMGFPFARRGIVFDGASSWFLPRIVGVSKAQELVLKGDIFDAQKALDLGLVSDICPREDVLPRAMALAQDIATHVSPTSAAHNKRLLRAAMLETNSHGGGPFGAHVHESRYLADAFVSPDCLEGVQAFLEKRPPQFKDRDSE